MAITMPPAHGDVRGRVVERLEQLIDSIAWAAVIAIGVGITANQPVVIQHTIGNQPILIVALSAFFLVGGGWGVVTTLLQLALFEAPAYVFSIGGLVLFGWNALNAGFHGFPATVTVSYSVAMVALVLGKAIDLWRLVHRKER